VIQAKTEARDDYGGIVETWATVATRWGSITPLTMRELVNAQQVEATLSHRVVLRHYPGLTGEHRLLFDARVFHIHAVRTLDERDRTTEVLAMEQP
jgi:SPP1 family predicted phage head-tail adaptor